MFGHHTVLSVQYTVGNKKSSVSSVHCAMCFFAVYSLQCTVQCGVCIVKFAWCSVYCDACSVQCVVSSVHCALCIVHGAECNIVFSV